MCERLYVITRRDLPLGAQAAQCCHAAAAFLLEHRLWNNQTLVLLTMANLRELELKLDEARWRGFTVSEFREPDLEDQLTAFAVAGEGAKKFFRRYPLIA